MGRSKAYPPLAFIDIETTGSHFWGWQTYNIR